MKNCCNCDRAHLGEKCGQKVLDDLRFGTCSYSRQPLLGSWKLQVFQVGGLWSCGHLCCGTHLRHVQRSIDRLGSGAQFFFLSVQKHRTPKEHPDSVN